MKKKKNNYKTNPKCFWFVDFFVVSYVRLCAKEKFVLCASQDTAQAVAQHRSNLRPKFLLSSVHVCSLSLSPFLSLEQLTAEVYIYATSKNEMKCMGTSTICQKSKNFPHENQLCSIGRKLTNRPTNPSHIQHKNNCYIFHCSIRFDMHSLR